MTTSGSNFNSGSTTSNIAAYSGSGNFDGTSLFTPTDGTTPASFIAVGDYVSLYNTGDFVSRCVAKTTIVAAGVNGAVTIDTTLKYGTVPTSNTGSRFLKAGGAWTSLQITAVSGAMNTGTVPQDTRINVKAGTYANTSLLRTLTLAGTAIIPLWWRGYKTTIGDQDTNNVAVAGTDIPSFTWTSSGINIAGAHQIFSNIDFNGARTSSQVNTSGSPFGLKFYRVRITNTNAAASSTAFTSGQSNLFVLCTLTITSVTTSTVITLGAANNNVLLGCIITGGSTGISFTSSVGNVIQWCVFDSTAGDAITFTTGGCLIANNIFYAQTGNGINITGISATAVTIINNYFESVNQAAKAAINNTSGTNSILVHCIENAYYNCTATILGITENFAILDNGVLATSALRAPLAKDFSLNDSVPIIGFPSLFENTNIYKGYADIGAIQRKRVLTYRGRRGN